MEKEIFPGTGCLINIVSLRRCENAFQTLDQGLRGFPSVSVCVLHELHARTARWQVDHGQYCQSSETLHNFKLRITISNEHHVLVHRIYMMKQDEASYGFFSIQTKAMKRFEIWTPYRQLVLRLIKYFIAQCYNRVYYKIIVRSTEIYTYTP